MSRRIRTWRALVTLLCVVALGGTAAAQDEDARDAGSHRAHVAVNPFGAIWGRYRAEAGLPVSGSLEIGAQVSYFNGEQFAAAIESADPGYWPNLFLAGGVIRLFPSGDAAGFFAGGRVMYLRFNRRDPAQPPAANVIAGIDAGWRWKWPLSGRVGMFFQAGIGVQRWLLAGDLQSAFGQLTLPVWPSAAVHIGLYL